MTKLSNEKKLSSKMNLISVVISFFALIAGLIGVFVAYHEYKDGREEIRSDRTFNILVKSLDSEWLNIAKQSKSLHEEIVDLKKRNFDVDKIFSVVERSTQREQFFQWLGFLNFVSSCAYEDVCSADAARRVLQEEIKMINDICFLLDFYDEKREYKRFYSFKEVFRTDC